MYRDAVRGTPIVEWPVHSGVPSDTAVGRERELVALSQAIDGVIEGRGHTVLIRGEAGIGKTRLVEDAARIARTRGVQVSIGHGDPYATFRVFGALREALGIDRHSKDQRRAEIAQLLDEVPGAAARATEPAQGAAFEGVMTTRVTDLVEDEAARGPLMLVLEDVQWADGSTVSALASLGRLIPQLPLLLVYTMRPTRGDSVASSIVDRLGALPGQDIALAGLDSAAAAELTRRILRHPPGPRLAERLRGARGNPLFILELLAALERDGALVAGADDALDLASATVTPSLPIAVLHRARLMPPASIEVLRMAAVLGGSFLVADLQLAVGRSATDMLQPIEDAIDSGFLVADGDRLAFRHDLIREALFNDIPLPLRLGLSRQFARSLAAGGASPERVAPLFARDAAVGDEEALEWLGRAAREAVARSPVVAAELFGQVLALLPNDDPRRDRALADRASVLALTDALPEAEGICQTILDRDHDPELNDTVRPTLVFVHLARGAVREAVSVARAALSDVATSALAKARLEAWCASVLGIVADSVTAEAMARAAVDDGTAVGDPMAALVGLGSLATVNRLRGRLTEATDAFRQAVDAADRSPGKVAHQFQFLQFLAVMLADLDEFTEARAAVSRGQANSELLGVRWNLPLYDLTSAYIAFFAGDWDECLESVEAARAQTRATGARHGFVMGESMVALVHLARGPAAAAAAALERAEHDLAATGPQFGSTWFAAARGARLVDEGRDSEAIKVLDAEYRSNRDRGALSECIILAPALAGLLARAGDRARAREIAKDARTAAALEPGLQRLQAVAARVEALANEDPDGAADAATAFGSVVRPFERAAAAEEAAAALLAAGRGDEAISWLQTAADDYERLSATRSVARVRSALRSLGARRKRSTGHRRPATGWESLTDAEQSVLELIRGGRSNPEIARELFISRHTVHSHVAHLFTKLDVGSRAELAVIAALHDERSTRPALTAPRAAPASH